jgi:hypothetical protein
MEDSVRTRDGNSWTVYCMIYRNVLYSHFRRMKLTMSQVYGLVFHDAVGGVNIACSASEN